MSFRLGLFTATALVAAYSFTASAERPRKQTASCDRQLRAPKGGKKRDRVLEPSLALKLDYGREELNAFFQANQDTMAAHFDRARLKALIEIVARGGTFSTEEIEEYKNFRYRLKAVRFAFVLFDQNHDCPDFIDDFIKVMGVLKDAFVNEKPEIARQAADELSVLLKNKNWARFDEELDSFEPSSGKAFRKFISRELDDIGDLMNQEQITGVKFHDIRKAVGRLLNLADTINSLEANPRHAEIVEFLDGLYGKMGAVHNKLMTKKLDGKIRYAKDPVNVPEGIRDLLDVLVTQFPSERE